MEGGGEGRGEGGDGRMEGRGQGGDASTIPSDMGRGGGEQAGRGGEVGAGDGEIAAWTPSSSESIREWRDARLARHAREVTARDHRHRGSDSGAGEGNHTGSGRRADSLAGSAAGSSSEQQATPHGVQVVLTAAAAAAATTIAAAAAATTAATAGGSHGVVEGSSNHPSGGASQSGDQLRADEPSSASTSPMSSARLQPLYSQQRRNLQRARDRIAVQRAAALELVSRCIACVPVSEKMWLNVRVVSSMHAWEDALSQLRPSGSQSRRNWQQGGDRIAVQGAAPL